MIVHDSNDAPQAVARSSPLSETKVAELAKGFQCEPKTLVLIAALFPLPTLGQAFVVRFLECAADERSRVPALQSGDVVVCAKSIAKLGERLGFSNDTTDKYVLLYKALGMLQKQKFLGQIAFIFSLGIYQSPASLEANLDFLIHRSHDQKSRTKLHILVTEVKQRCLVYGLLTQDFTDTLKQIHLLLQPQDRLSRRKFEQRVQQAQHVVSTLLKQTLMGHLSTEYRRVDSFKNGTLTDRREYHNESTRTQQGNEDTHREGIRNLPVGEHWVDALGDQQTVASTQSDTQGRLLFPLGETHLPNDAMRVDSSESADHRASTVVDDSGRFPVPPTPTRIAQVENNQDEQSPESTQGGDKGRREEDSLVSHLPIHATGVDSPASLRNVDVINTYDFIVTFTLREPQLVAKFFAERLEEDSRVYPKYQKLFITQEGQPRPPHVLAAAFVCTMVRLHRDKWELHHPGGFFTSRCREFDTTVSPEAEEWVSTYGHLSPTRLIETLTQGSQGTSPKYPVKPAVFVAKAAPAPLLPPLELVVKVDVARVALSEVEADILLKTVLEHPVMKSFRARRVKVGKESPRYAVLLDTTIALGSVSQTILYQPHDWVERLEQMKTMRHRLASSLSVKKGN